VLSFWIGDPDSPARRTHHTAGRDDPCSGDPSG
jgi:hypothetical protein